MSTDKFKIGNTIKYTYEPGKPESGWFLAKIVEIRDSGYVADLVDKGENTPYSTNTFRGIHLGEDANRSVELHSPEPVRLGGDVIGTAPVVVTPRLTAPFHSDSDRVQDSKGNLVAWVDSDWGSDEDRVIAEVIAAALNEYFGESTESVEAPKVVSPETVRYIIDQENDVWFDVDGTDRYIMSFADKDDAPNLEQYESSVRRNTGSATHPLTRSEVRARYSPIRSEGMYEISL